MNDFIKKNFDLPENRFYFYNTKLHPLSFVLDWDTENGFYKNLLNRHFACVCEEPNEHSLVLAKPEETKYFHHQIPAFNIQFIEDCFRLKDFPDPNVYMIQNSCLVTYKTSDIYDCWYHQNKSWFDLVGSMTSSDNGANTNVAKEGRWISCEKVTSPNQDVVQEIRTDNDDHHCHSVRNNKDKTNLEKKKKIISVSSDDEVVQSASVSSETAPNKRTRLPYSMREEKEIVKYIIKNKHAFDVYGKEMWERMERENVCKIRTWQSMKERYLKHIRWDLVSKSHKFDFLSDYDLRLLRQGLKIDAINPEDKKKLKSQSIEERIDEFDSN